MWRRRRLHSARPCGAPASVREAQAEPICWSPGRSSTWGSLVTGRGPGGGPDFRAGREVRGGGGGCPAGSPADEQRESSLWGPGPLECRRASTFAPVRVQPTRRTWPSWAQGHMAAGEGNAPEPLLARVSGCFPARPALARRQGNTSARQSWTRWPPHSGPLPPRPTADYSAHKAARRDVSPRPPAPHPASRKARLESWFRFGNPRDEARGADFSSRRVPRARIVGGGRRARRGAVAPGRAE